MFLNRGITWKSSFRKVTDCTTECVGGKYKSYPLEGYFDIEDRSQSRSQGTK